MRNNNAEFLDSFSEISNAIVGRCIALTDVSLVSRDKRIYRARVSDAGERKEILESSRKLKTISEFSDVYINRDLTFNQRRELFQRRLSLNRNSPGASVPASVCNVVSPVSTRLLDQSSGAGAVTAVSAARLLAPDLPNSSQNPVPSSTGDSSFLTTITLK